jgi:exodeoxyribonuclease VII small subunit
MPDELSFEDALAKLEETVRRLEAGNLPLDEAVALFEEGTRLARQCNERLEAAELKVSLLTRTENGQLTERDMAVDVDDTGSESGA